MTWMFTDGELNGPRYYMLVWRTVLLRGDARGAGERERENKRDACRDGHGDS